MQNGNCTLHISEVFIRGTGKYFFPLYNDGINMAGHRPNFEEHVFLMLFILLK